MATSLIQVRIDNDLNGISFSMALPSDKNSLALNGLQALDAINSSSEKSGVSDLSLDDINSEINLARRSS